MSNLALGARIVCAIAASCLAHEAPAAPLNPSTTFATLFNWRWTDVATECTARLGPMGYGAVQVSPPQVSAYINEVPGSGNPSAPTPTSSSPPQNPVWWDIYQPVDYTALNSAMGTQSQFASMVSACHAAGVQVYADVVFNQMGGASSTAAGVGYTGNTGAGTAPAWDVTNPLQPHYSNMSYATSDFHYVASSSSSPTECLQGVGEATTAPNYDTIQSSDYNSSTQDVQYCRLDGLPDLATENSSTQTKLATYLKLLLDNGVDGFRIDAAKHQQAAALGQIIQKAQTLRNSSLTNLGLPIFITQEVIPDGETTISNYTPNIGGSGGPGATINNFTYTYLLQDVFRNYTDSNGRTMYLSSVPSAVGDPVNGGGIWAMIPAAQSTVFVNNWDTERGGNSLDASNYSSGAVNDTQGTKRYDLANIFMLAYPYGTANVESGFRFTNTDMGHPSASPYSNGVPQINVVWDFIHYWGDIANMVAFRNYTVSQPVANWTIGTATYGSGTYGTNSNQVAFSRGGVGWVAINNDPNNAWSGTVQTGLPSGTYCNVIHGLSNGTSCAGDSVFVGSNGTATFTIPANNGGASVPAIALYTGQMMTGTAMCSVSFTIANANTTFGQNVYVAGNQTVLGNRSGTWTPSVAFPLTIQGNGANVPWSGTANLPCGTAIQYKYILYNPSTQAVTWESGNNRQLTTPSSGSLNENDGNF